MYSRQPVDRGGGLIARWRRRGSLVYRSPWQRQTNTSAPCFIDLSTDGSLLIHGNLTHSTPSTVISVILNNPDP